MKKAIILFNLGGPDKLENVEPFLFNLFYDPAILNLPNFLRYPLAKLISKRRAPIAKKIYEELGGSSPILKLTLEQSNALEKTLNQKGFSTAVGDEGGFAPGIDSAEEALDFISSSIRDAGYQVNKDVTFALDCAATELMKKNEYIFSNKIPSSA